MVIAPAPSRKIVKQLVAAGFAKRDGKGSHTFWTCHHGIHHISVPTGHRTISPGVRSKVNAKIAECQSYKEK